MADFALSGAARNFTGRGAAHGDWSLLLGGDTIAAIGPSDTIDAPAHARRIELGDATLLPGLIDLHSHVLLCAYNRMPWNDQVLYEAQAALRVARATTALRAGSTLLRDLGTEGAGHADVGLKAAVAQGVIPGPRPGGRDGNGGSRLGSGSRNRHADDGQGRRFHRGGRRSVP